MYSDPSRFSSLPSYSFFIEKPGLFYFSGDSNLILTPGVSYYNFSQDEGPGNALGRDGTLNIDHSSFSPYLKVIYTKNYKPEKIFCWYFGIVAGVHLFTKTHGRHSWWILQEQGYNSGSETIDTDARQFYNILYLGLAGGFAPKVGVNAFIKPSFEVTFLPNFVNITDPPVQTFAKKGVKNVVMFSVILGI